MRGKFAPSQLLGVESSLVARINVLSKLVGVVCESSRIGPIVAGLVGFFSIGKVGLKQPLQKQYVYDHHDGQAYRTDCEPAHVDLFTV